MTIVGILVGLLIIGLMMLVHEAGHFFAGRLLKFKILEFSIFMGPRLFTTEKNGIKYSFRLLPIGASVQFAGEYDDDTEAEDAEIEKDDPGLFFNRPRWARAIVVAMGPIANFVTAFLASVIMFTAFGTSIPVVPEPPENTLAQEAGLEAGDRIISLNGERIRTNADYSIARALIKPGENLVLKIEKPNKEQVELVLKPRYEDNYRLGIVQGLSTDQKNIILEVDPDSNQGNPVLEVEDVLISVNGIPFSDQKASSEEIRNSAGKELDIKVVRSDKEIDLKMKTTLYNDQVPDGIYFTESKAAGDILYQAIQYPWSIVKSTIKGLGMVISGQTKFSESVTGPVGIVKMFSDVVTEGSKTANIGLVISQLLFYFILISVAIGFTNLLPIPPLDGHLLLILLIEGIIGRDLPENLKHVITKVGMILILVLAVFVIYFDLRRIL